jgi:hypothetical protein
VNLRGQGDAALVTQVRPVGDEVWLILLVLLEITDMLSEVNVAQIAFGMSSILDYLLSLALDESVDESFSAAPARAFSGKLSHAKYDDRAVVSGRPDAARTSKVLQVVMILEAKTLSSEPPSFVYPGPFSSYF